MPRVFNIVQRKERWALSHQLRFLTIAVTFLDQQMLSFVNNLIEFT